ncbi:aspartic proteinase nepenthesin-2-like [Cryptomeria japonica]|uniref:aspartic proteinase nepenthesin-2-like n=1 Tax=Cryptomeria japonica TaxID=3369 RepID=UPI0027D9EF5A|nr:aspartic proteinase nepenthesin-2-like [Cryptomeria japonica]
MAFRNNVALLLLVMITVMDWHANALRADMKRVHGSSMTSSQRLSAAVHRSSARLRKIETSVTGKAVDTDLAAPVNRGNNVAEFLVSMGIRTPPQKMVAIVDTGSDLIWKQCQPCKNCYDQTDPIFDPSKSSTYAKLPCNSSLCSSLPRKTANTFIHSPRVDGFTDADGVLGLGRGSFSLVSQMGSRFSYCVTSFMDESPSDTSPLFFGSATDLRELVGVQFTPLMTNLFRPELNSFYYISVEAIAVGNRLAYISQGTLDIQEDGSGGFIIDSGSAFSYLIPEAFSLVADAVDLAVGWDRADGSDYGFSLCYQIPQGNTTYVFPDITFIFSRNVPFVVDQKYNFRLVDEQSGLVFMLILQIEETSALKSPSILGSYQQQNYHILYDNGNYMLSFAPTTCAELL